MPHVVRRTAPYQGTREVIITFPDLDDRKLHQEIYLADFAGSSIQAITPDDFLAKIAENALERLQETVAANKERIVAKSKG
jgi:hypothetical protein